MTTNVDMASTSVETRPYRHRPPPLSQVLEVPTAQDGPLPHIQFTMTRLLNEIDESDVHNHPVMTDLRRQLLTLSERLNETASTSTTQGSSEVEAEMSEDASTIVRHRQSAPSSAVQSATMPRNGSVIRSSSQVFAGNNLDRNMRTFFGFDSNNNNINEAPHRNSNDNERPDEAAPPRTLAQDLRDLAGVLSNPAVQAVVGNSDDPAHLRALT